MTECICSLCIFSPPADTCIKKTINENHMVRISKYIKTLPDIKINGRVCQTIVCFFIVGACDYRTHFVCVFLVDVQMVFGVWIQRIRKQALVASRKK